MGVLDSLSNASARPDTANDDGVSASLAVKKKAIEEYKSSTAPLTLPKPVRFEPTPAEKINPRAKYGDRPNEKRIDTSSMTKPLGSYEKGTTHVPKTGVYKLHEGEAVVPAKENPMSSVYDKITEGMKKPKKVVKEVRTRRAASGGWIHEHHHTEPAHHPMEEHTTSDKDGMLAHMAEHMGSAPAPEADQSASQAQDAAVGA